MTRFTDPVVVELQKEAISPRVTINWNVLDNSASIDFSVAYAVYQNGVITSIEKSTPLDLNTLRVNFSDIAARVFNVPLPDGSFQPVPAMLIMGAVKQAFDELYSEEMARLFPTPTPTPTDTPTPTPTDTPTP